MLTLGDGVVDHGSYARQRRSTFTFSSSWSRQSRDDRNDETLRHHQEMMQHMMPVVHHLDDVGNYL
jgi:hypothetical protein